MTSSAASPTPAALARSWFEDMWNRRDERLLAQLMAENVHGEAEGGRLVGRQAWIEAAYRGFLGAFPDLKLEVHGTIAEGNEVVVRWSATGTHLGDTLGLAASGRKVRFRGMTWLRFRNGQIVEGTDSWNQAALLQALRSGLAMDSVQLLP